MTPTSATKLKSPVLSGWQIDVQGPGTVAITPPTKNTFVIHNGTLDEQKLRDLGDSDFLWITSLAYLPYLIDNNQIALAHSIVSSCWGSLRRSDGRSRILSSQDHIVAQRLQAIAYMLSVIKESTGEADQIFRSDIEWALVPQNMAKNNHGIMLCSSLFYAAQMLTDSETANRVEFYASVCVRTILDEIFGEDGYCDENSPFYAHLYIIKVRQLVEDYSDALRRGGVIHEVTGHHQRAIQALANQTYSDGMLPAIGDTSENISPYKGESGTYCSRRTGIWIHKSENLYVSMRGGSTSAIHRHADDLSLIVRYAGVELVSDSGFHSYDYKDPRVRMLRSQRGHSGVYFREYDDLINGELFGARRRIISTIQDTTGGKGPSVRGAYTIDQSHTAYRAVEVNSDRTIAVRDDYHSLTGLLPVQRFVIPMAVDVVQDGATIQLAREGIVLTLRPDYDFALEMTSGELDYPFRGWRSPLPQQMTASKCMELTPKVHHSKGLGITLTIDTL